MSAVWVRLDDAQRGSLPARCARSGERSITRYPHQVTDLPPALEWATWTRLWPRGRDTAAVTVIVPLLPSRHRAATALRQARDVSAGLLPVALIAMLVTSGLVGRLAGAVTVGAMLVHLVVAVLGSLITVRLRTDVTGQWVHLSGVHPTFVAATEAVTTRPTNQPQLAQGVVARFAGAPSREPLEP